VFFLIRKALADHSNEFFFKKKALTNLGNVFFLIKKSLTGFGNVFFIIKKAITGLGNMIFLVKTFSLVLGTCVFFSANALTDLRNVVFLLRNSLTGLGNVLVALSEDQRSKTLINRKFVMNETLKLDGNFLMKTFDSKTCHHRYWKPYFDEKGWKLKQFHLSRLHPPNYWFFLDKFPCFLDQKFDISFFLVIFTKCWEKNNQHTWKLMFEKPFWRGAGGAVWGWISPHKRQVIHYFWQLVCCPKPHLVTYN